jgi:peptidoglycan/xylan/chitin deacetylase (PgdA/CDA1 family)/SAM-dependent methyltransferase
LAPLKGDSRIAPTARPSRPVVRPGVSVIIAAHNAEQTVGETLDCLLHQTHARWEGLVVDDGSGDATADIATRFAARDDRIRLISQPRRGESGARNTGIEHARFEWLLFLDSDDWLRPGALERLGDAALAAPDADAVHGAWGRVTPDGKLAMTHFWDRPDEIFSQFAVRCLFPVHSCMVRRSLVRELDGFDTSFHTCADWDLWQRVARSGARFEGVGEVLAMYRMRPTSTSADGFRLISDGLQVISRGHSADPRVPKPHPDYADGAPREGHATARLHFACWTAGLVIGRNADARPLLHALADEREPALNGSEVADLFIESVPLGACTLPSAWGELWPACEQPLDEFVAALERQANAPGLARRARVSLERLVVPRCTGERPLTVGSTHAVTVEATAPLLDVVAPRGAQRLQCRVELEGDALGDLELPVCDGQVPRYVLADAISARYYWTILGEFFANTVYAERKVGEDAAIDPHDEVGWTVFLQELWGRPGWSAERFYDGHAAEPGARLAHAEDGWLTVEASDELPDVELGDETVQVVFTVGGAAIALVPISGSAGRGRLRAALTRATGTELCQVAVREGLLGAPLGGPCLRERLAAAAEERLADRTRRARAPAGIVIAPGSDGGLSGALSDGRPELVLGRRDGPPGTSVSRRATLPSAAAAELTDAARAAGEPVIATGEPGVRPERLSYSPELFWRASGPVPPPGDEVTRRHHPAPDTEQRRQRPFPFDRHYFERVFVARPDPWHYTNAYEQTKYRQTLALVPSPAVETALEIGCAEGRFTQLLAPRVGNLTAADISEVALRRAAARCDGLQNVRFHRFDLLEDPVPGRYDLIVCSELLYFMGDRRGLSRAARKIARALAPGGHLVMTHSNLVVDEPEQPGFNWDFPFGAKAIADTFAATRPLRHVREWRAAPYRIQLFRAERWTRRLRHRRRPIVTQLPPPPPLPRHVAGDFVSAGRPARVDASAAIVTNRLPILMYHRVAAAGAPSTARYRVAPEAFEQQLRYLRDAGFYGVGVDDWREAMERRRPLPGRAVMLTFDDGYMDFRTDAWPVLRRYGFLAVVFLVTDEVGGTNRWDHVLGEGVPLLGWPDIAELSREGVAFGAHSASHPRLTSLSVTEVAREAARSRASLHRGLGRPVSAFAYPHGDCDPGVQHLIGATGFVYGFTCRNERSAFHDNLLDLPRIEIEGSDTLEDFIAKLDIDEASPLSHRASSPRRSSAAGLAQ